VSGVRFQKFRPVNDWNTEYNFQEASRRAASLIPATTPVAQVDPVLMTDTAAKAAIIANLNQGPKLVNFLGHGSVGIWNGNLFTSPTPKLSETAINYRSTY
jgi:hypothetical protein